ncbi:glycosyltransferase family 2 protein [Pseudovibrio sp. SPO723]|uniref:glycosyltransferase family 2 protein n=1 Tax=Nesiotobacter zosterae TaxID=392721 RepID=UPI0029C542E0|nr:glycosyltransferase family 2 protein [Pseudovibrio sp. SPO723]MDX5594294.1 glycosyltransferase family 2 protein [Pseudovibrio sp. SPO723]
MNLKEKLHPIAEKLFPLICVLRNERDILPAFLSHYRGLGVNLFHFVDTGSTDGSIQYLKDQKDTQVYLKKGGYAQANAGIDWVNEIGCTSCTGTWTLVVDADEFLQLPQSEEKSPLAQVSAVMRRELAFGLYAPLIDFFADDLTGHLNTQKNLQGLLQGSPNYVPFANCNFSSMERFPFGDLRSNARARISGTTNYRVRSYKIPLVFWRPGFQYVHSTHVCTPIPLSDVSYPIYHFKYRPGFEQRLSKDMQSPDRLNADVYRISRSIIRHQDRIASNTVMIKDGHELEGSDWVTKDGFSKKWLELNKSKSNYFDVLSEQKSISESELTAKLQDLTETSSWRCTRPIRSFLYRKGVLRHDHFPERFKQTNVHLDQVVAVYESFWWLLTGVLRIPKALRKSLLWHKLRRR